jgi:hypothetical protein
MFDWLSKVRGEPDLIRLADMLLTKEQHAVIEERLMQTLNDVAREGQGKIKPTDFRA